MNINLSDQLSFADNSNMKHGLRGHVKIELENTETKERKFWYEDDNIIPISGYQWILMKMFGLHLDSVHDPNVKYEVVGQDTSLVIPDLNEVGQQGIGRDPQDTRAGYGYTPMDEDIASNHFIQGFLVGNGGAAEDVITTKNTDYSYTNLRSAIPFQQVGADSSLDSSIAGKYLGVYRQPGGTKSYFIKKFDSRAHIYHNWWRDGQRWDYVDPVIPPELGPGRNGNNVNPKSNRIETYAEVEMSIDVKNDDCLGYFNQIGNTETAKINELGLVAFDTVPGERSTIEQLYNTLIKRMITLIFDDERGEFAGSEIIDLANDIYTVMNENSIYGKQTNMDNFIDLISVIAGSTADTLNYEYIQNELTSVDEHDNPINIGVQAFYNQNHTFQYFTDKFLYYLSQEQFSDLTTDEAQRIKLVTYYTFNSIPLQENWKVLISYRIYAN